MDRHAFHRIPPHAPVLQPLGLWAVLLPAALHPLLLEALSSAGIIRRPELAFWASCLQPFPRWAFPRWPEVPD